MHFLSGLGIGEQWPNAGLISALDQVPARFDLSAALLDGSLSSLKLIDAAVARIGAVECLRMQYFLPLVAYCTEVVRRETSGTLEMRCSKDGTVWEPLVVAGDRIAFPALDLYKALDEDNAGYPPSVYGAISSTISSLK